MTGVALTACDWMSRWRERDKSLNNLSATPGRRGRRDQAPGRRREGGRGVPAGSRRPPAAYELDLTVRVVPRFD